MFLPAPPIMPTKPDNPKPRLSPRRRILKWVGRFLLVLIILLIAGLFLPPKIAPRLLDRFAADLDLDHFEVEVVEVTWNTATLNDLSAANAGWQARADTILVHYSPDIDRDDVGNLIEQFRRETGTSYETLAEKIGVCSDTLVNLKNERDQPAHRTDSRLKAFAESLES